MKTAISVPDNVFRSAETLAKRLGVSRSKLYTRAVSEYVSRHRRSEITQRLNEIYASENSNIDSALAGMQWASLPKEKWK